MTEKKKVCASGNFVICDVQEEYSEQLLKILAEQFAGEYQFHLFYDFEKMKEFMEHSSHADILLIGEEYAEQLETFHNHGRTIILSEIPARSGEEEETRVFRYQSADSILRDISRAAGRSAVLPDRKSEDKRSEERRGREAEGKNTKKKGGVKIRDEPPVDGKQIVRGIIGIYSPIHRIGKTKFAIRFGQRMARQIPVLYLNLEGYSGMDYYFQEGQGKNLGDLLYCMKQERGDYGIKISSMTGQAGGMDYILPMENEQDLKAVKCSEWLSLIDMISEKCIYEAVILDLGECIDGVYEILRKCTRIYTPYIREGAAAAKLEQYENNLKSAGYGDILARTVKREMKRNSNPGSQSKNIRKSERTGTI